MKVYCLIEYKYAQPHLFATEQAARKWILEDRELYDDEDWDELTTVDLAHYFSFRYEVREVNE